MNLLAVLGTFLSNSTVMDWRSPCPEVNRVVSITQPELVECILLTLFSRVKDDFPFMYWEKYITDL